MTPQVCPNCGAEVPPNAKACPECGSDENTGWSDNARIGSLNLPNENFDYNEFVQREFGKEKSTPVRGISMFWWVVALLTTLAMLFVFAGWLFG
jgi:hypothetical protein